MFNYIKTPFVNYNTKEFIQAFESFFSTNGAAYYKFYNNIITSVSVNSNNIVHPNPPLGPRHTQYFCTQY